MNGMTRSLPLKVGALLLAFLCILAAAVSCAGMLFAVNADLYSGADLYPNEASLLEAHGELKGELYYSSAYCRALSAETARELTRMAKRGEEIGQFFGPQDTNLRAVIRDPQGELVFSSDEAVLLSADQGLKWIDRAEFDKRLQNGVTGQPGSYLDPSTGDLVVWEPETALPEGTVYITVFDGELGGYRLCLMLAHPMTVRDGFRTQMLTFRRLYPLRWVFPAAAAGAALVGLCCVIFLCCAAGHRRDCDGVKLNRFDRFPLDLLLLIAAMLTAQLAAIIRTAGGDTLRQAAVFSLCCGGIAAVWLPPLLTLCTRVKAGKWWRGTAIYAFLHLIGRLLRALWRGILAIPMVWRTLLAGCVLLLMHLFLASLTGFRRVGPVAASFLLGCALVIAACFFSYQMQILRRAGRALAQGNFDQKVATRGMLPDLKEHGENLNSVGDGLSAAVEQRMRSERMKTELITNVSHDIKTPLTSIINYVDLLQRDPSPEEREQYLAVLDRQAKRLKKLTEDLVEASKASSGALTVHPVPVDLHEFLNQAMGEYEDRLERARLTLVAGVTGEGLAVMADPRYLWRILDNLLNNACKYAMPETRVYLDALAQGVYSVITVKNVSREALNVAPEELTERFVQGDSSRRSEGSGLGLNIAKSLAELQSGSLSVQIDGDLFKVTLSLPRCELPAKEELQ